MTQIKPTFSMTD